MTAPGDGTDADARLQRVGRRAWAALGVAGVLVLVYLLLRQVSLVATPLAIALFPAAVLWPVAVWLKRRRLPASLAALLLVLGLLGLLALTLWFIVPRFAAELPDLAESVEGALDDLDEFLADTPFALPGDFSENGLSGLADEASSALGEQADVVGQGLDVARTLTDVVTSTVLFLVALFFYLRDGDRIWTGITSLLPITTRRNVRRVSGQLFWTLGAYFRGQMLVALVDAVAIGIGLALLGIPLVLPLALLVFIGGFFPIVGAFVSGLVAVLVALADQGLVTALLTLGLIVLVQQAEGNLLEPLILAPVLRLHPFLIILAITAGAVTYGVLGAFLAVPLAACAGRIVDYLRGRRPTAGPASDEDAVWGASRRQPLRPAAPTELEASPRDADGGSAPSEPDAGRGSPRP